ncbi:MAG: hypothetical protein GOMPHAMPRED_005702 [Gomphillus americanus]|uniref:Flavin reductase like domain-containing protein n=1 Tax=Gomphillus americanus TaxID=1940652 RepID=A0A8H3ISY9_9LECA|nr:MAG: hypothetical protein GOMPHAMPRED_005702 [Gomphillus americanus]
MEDHTRGSVEDNQVSEEEHSVINPAILYWGTPVVLITTLNEDGSPNIAPMSSAFWLGNFCVLGLAKYSKTTANLLRTKQCVLNLPSEDGAQYVNAIARTTGSDPVPERKINLGYTHLKDKFGAAGLTQQDSDLVAPPRIKQCPVQMEAEYLNELDMGFAVVIQVVVRRIHVIDKLRLPGHANRIDANSWKPLIMSFQKLYGLRSGEVLDSRLAEINEELYRR